MASCITPTFGNSSSPQIRLTVTQSGSTDSTVTLSWKLEYVAHGYAVSTSVAKTYNVIINGETVKTGSFSINGISDVATIATGTEVINKTASEQSISFSCSMAFNITWNGVYGATKSASGYISIAAKTSYKVSYDANGGTGTPSTQTKWHDYPLTLSSISPVKSGYVFKGWSTSLGGAAIYQPSDEYVANASVTLYAVWQASVYTIKYNANGGTGAPANQSKAHGTALTLSSVRPTRNNYGFKGWGTSPSSLSVAYAPGASYTANASITLYAIWEYGYVEPIVDKASVERCTESGVLDSDGTNALVSFNWSCQGEIASIKIEWIRSNQILGQTKVTATGSSGRVEKIIGNGSLDVSLSYIIRSTITDSSGGSTIIEHRLYPASYILDFLANGKGISIGKEATKEGLRIGWDIYDKDDNPITGLTYTEGSNSNGYYRKWSNGILECWINKTDAVWPISTAYGSFYYGNYSWTFPMAFIDVPDEVNLIRAWWGSGASWGSVYNFSKTAASFRAYDIATRSSDANMKFSAYAKGKWK